MRFFFTLVALALALWAFWLEPASLRVREYALEAPRLQGLRIAVLADLHVGSPYNGLEKLERIVRETNAAKPDLILLAGDYVIHKVRGGRFIHPHDFAPILGKLEAKLGVWAVLGNHDHWFKGASPVPGPFQKAGIGLLEDRAVRLPDFWLAGVSDLWEAPHDVRGTLAQVTDDAPVILFTHNPDIFPEVPARVSLTIAGHTHGGQVWLPLLGRPIVPSDYGERFALGPVVENGRLLFVSPGLGTSLIPVRFFTPPEISLLELN